ncbi:hypothetical protein ACRBEJ_13585 [Yersinia proxima]|uniref:hypothetical protein n=2 Tax=Yersinia proxima TaxID=2890316 RepID=UPI003D6883D3
MRKHNNRKSKKVINKSETNEKKQGNNYPFRMSGDFITFCENLTKHLESKSSFSPDYYFCKAIIAREEKKFQLERQSILNLLIFTDGICSEVIDSVLNKNKVFEYTEKTQLILASIRDDTDIHPYLKLIIAFMLSGTKQQLPAYFNCFMGRSANIIERLPQFDVSQISDIELLIFYEVTHRILIDDSSNLDILEKLTSFIYERVKRNACQSLLFFVSYFKINSDAHGAIEAANLFLDAQSIPVNRTNYLQTLAWNTAWVAIKFADIDEAEFWLENIEDSEKNKKVKDSIESLLAKNKERNNHPLNPESISPKYIEEIETIDLITLCAFLDGCGDDWGLKELNRSGKYIFPSESLTIRMFKSLAVKGIVKMSQTNFLNISDSKINDFDDIVFKVKFHTNINGVGDTKQLALKLLFEEIERREDRFDASFQTWKTISTGYFYSSMEHYLSNVNDNWASDFTLNEKTVERISSTFLSAKDLSYIARSAIGYAAGQHSIGSSKGNKHTCNILIASINRNLDWVVTGEFSPKTFPRNKKQPVLSSEKIVEQICNISTEDMYNIQPEVTLCYGEEFTDNDDF